MINPLIKFEYSKLALSNYRVVFAPRLPSRNSYKTTCRAINVVRLQFLIDGDCLKSDNFYGLQMHFLQITFGRSLYDFPVSGIP